MTNLKALSDELGISQAECRRTLEKLGFDVLVSHAERLRHREAFDRGMTPEDLFKPPIEMRYVATAFKEVTG